MRERQGGAECPGTYDRDQGQYPFAEDNTDEYDHEGNLKNPGVDEHQQEVRLADHADRTPRRTRGWCTIWIQPDLSEKQMLDRQCPVAGMYHMTRQNTQGNYTDDENPVTGKSPARNKKIIPVSGIFM